MGFSDAVVSIATTLLVLDLMIPAGLPDDQVGPALAEATPQFVAYALSFAVIGRAWMNHHHKFSVIHAFDRGLQWLNLLTLFFVALLPMPTAYLSDYAQSGSPWPIVLYAVVTAGVYLSLNLTWRHAWHAGLIDPGVDEAAYRSVLVAVRPVPLSSCSAFRWHSGIRAGRCFRGYFWCRCQPLPVASGGGDLGSPLSKPFRRVQPPPFWARPNEPAGALSVR